MSGCVFVCFLACLLAFDLGWGFFFFFFFFSFSCCFGYGFVLGLLGFFFFRVCVWGGGGGTSMCAFVCGGIKVVLIFDCFFFFACGLFGCNL